MQSQAPTHPPRAADRTVRWPRTPRAPRLRRTLRGFAVLATVAAIAVPTLAPAHDWISPTAVTLLESAAAHRRAPSEGWSGTLWTGVGRGAPAAPSATDCRRPPATFDLPGYEPPRAQRGEPAVAVTGAAPGRATAAATLSRPASPPPASPPSPATRADAEAGAATAAAESRRSGEFADRRHRMRSRAEPLGDSAVAVAPGTRPPPAPHAAPQLAPRPADEPVSAGMVDDNADFGAYLAYRQRWPQLARRDLDPGGRVLLDVRDAAGRAVPDARVQVRAAGRELPLWARTDAGGRAWLMPQRDAAAPAGQPLEVEVTRGSARTRVLWTPGQKDVLQARLAAEAGAETVAAPWPARLDLVFVVDATGSMGDEIDKLKRSMRAVADEIARLPARPDLCFGLVAYRDRGDAFFVRGADLTNDLGAFQRVLENLQAGGGGDYPEAMNEALHTAVHRISWRGEGTARMVVLVADAPPHLDYPGPQYDHDLRAAAARGIKVFGVGASGLDPQGEFVLRQAAQFTGGRFVFLTYAQANRPASGPGRETVHDVQNYSVETLDRLLVRLVSEEMARWPQPAP